MLLAHGLFVRLGYEVDGVNSRRMEKAGDTLFPPKSSFISR
jgi:hypothetical protein